MEALQRDEIGRILDEDLVARIDQRGADHLQRLLGAVGDDDIIGHDVIHAEDLITLGNPRAQRLIALRVAVLQGDGALLLHDLVDGGVHLLHGEGNGVRQTAGEGNDVRRGGSGEDARGKFSLKIGLGDLLGQLEFHFYAPLRIIARVALYCSSVLNGCQL